MESIAKQRRWGARGRGEGYTCVLLMKTKAGFLAGPMHSSGDLRQARVCPAGFEVFRSLGFQKQQIKSLEGEESGQNSQTSLKRVLPES